MVLIISKVSKQAGRLVRHFVFLVFFLVIYMINAMFVHLLEFIFLCSIYVMVQVNPKLYGDHNTRFFVYWTVSSHLLKDLSFLFGIFKLVIFFMSNVNS